MSVFTIDLHQDSIDEIIIKELSDMKESLKLDIKRRKNGEIQFGVFHNDMKKDIKELKKHIKSINRILEYHGVYNDLS